MSLISLDFQPQASDSLGQDQQPKANALVYDASHSEHSSLREKVIEHLFLGELMRSLWTSGCRNFEVLHSGTDLSGYDVLIEANGIQRHIQLKASFIGAKTARINANTALTSKPSGCIVWIWFDPGTMKLGPLLWFGDEPGEPLPPLGDRIGKHSKGDQYGVKAERPNVRVLNKGRFRPLATVDELATKLFG